MKFTANLVIALIVMVSPGIGTVHARPIVIEESALITPPPGAVYEQFGTQVGTNGDFALVLGVQPQPPDAFSAQTFDALLYRRISGKWVFQRLLAQGTTSEDDYSAFPTLIGMNDNLASTLLGGRSARIFYFNGTDWINQNQALGFHEDVSIDGSARSLWSGRGMERPRLRAQCRRRLDVDAAAGPATLLRRRILGRARRPAGRTRDPRHARNLYSDEPQEIPIYQRYERRGAGNCAPRSRCPKGNSALAERWHCTVRTPSSPRRPSGPYVWNSSDNFAVPTGRLRPGNAYASGAST